MAVKMILQRGFQHPCPTSIMTIILMLIVSSLFAVYFQATATVPELFPCQQTISVVNDEDMPPLESFAAEENTAQEYSQISTSNYGTGPNNVFTNPAVMLIME